MNNIDKKMELAKMELVKHEDRFNFLIKMELAKREDRFNFLVQEGIVLKIIDEKTKNKCIDLIRELKGLAGQYKNLLKPIKEIVKRIEGNIKPYEKKLEELLGKNSKEGLRGQLGLWEMKVQEEARKREEKLRYEQQKRYEEELARAEKQKEIPPPPPPPVNIEVKKEKGVSYTTEYGYEVININEVDRQYLMLDEKKVRQHIKEGSRNIKGLRIFERIKTTIREESLEDL